MVLNHFVPSRAVYDPLISSVIERSIHEEWVSESEVSAAVSKSSRESKDVSKELSSSTISFSTSKSESSSASES